MNSNRNNYIYNILLVISQVVFPLITFPYIARILNPEGIGLISFVDSFSKYFILVAALGLPIYGIREVSKHKHDKDKLNSLFTELFCIHTFLTIITLFFYFFIIFYFYRFSTDLKIYFLGGLMIFFNLFLVEWLFQGIGNFRFIAIRGIIVRIISTFSIFLFVKNENDTNIYFLIWLLVVIVNGALNFFKVRKVVSFVKIDFKNIFSHLKPLFYVFASISFVSIYTLFDIILLGILSDNKSVGVYSTATKISKLPIILVGALGNVAISKLSLYFHQGKNKEFLEIIHNSLLYIFSISFPIMFLILGISKELILQFAGPAFLNSYVLLNMMSGLCFFVGLSNIFGLQILTSISKDKYFLYSVLIGAIVSIFFNLVLIPDFKEFGATLSFILTEIVVFLATFFFARKLFIFNIDYKLIFFNFLLSIPFFFFSKMIFFLDLNFYFSILVIFFFSIFYFIFYQYLVLKNKFVIDFVKMLYERI